MAGAARGSWNNYFDGAQQGEVLVPLERGFLVRHIVSNYYTERVPIASGPTSPFNGFREKAAEAAKLRI